MNKNNVHKIPVNRQYGQQSGMNRIKPAPGSGIAHNNAAQRNKLQKMRQHRPDNRTAAESDLKNAHRNKNIHESAPANGAVRQYQPGRQPAQRQNAQVMQPEVNTETGRRRYFYDTSLLCAVIFIFALGLLIIYSSSQYMAQLERGGDPAYYFKRQLAVGCVGLASAFVMSLLDYRWIRNIGHGIAAEAAYWVSVALLMLTTVLGVASHGKMRWISIGGIQFQPAEVAKIALIVWLACYISFKGRSIRRRDNMLRAIWHAGLPFVLILKQNISSAIIVALIAAVMIFVAVDNKKIFVILGGAAAAFVAGLKPLIRLFINMTGYSKRPEQYYLRRVLGWAAPDVFPDDAYQTLQSLYAIGSGGMTGHGLGESIQKFGKIPEVQNDMIFAIVCEEFGFIGAATIVLLFMYLIFRIYQIARNADDVFGTMLCTGVMAHIGIQAVLNIAVVTGVIPNTGVTLPFISYGGSAVLFTMMEIGMVLSVAHKIPR